MKPVDRIRARICAGDKLHMEIVDGRRRWWFEQPTLTVRDADVLQLLDDPDSPLHEAGDSLFGEPLSSQTYIAGGV